MARQGVESSPEAFSILNLYDSETRLKPGEKKNCEGVKSEHLNAFFLPSEGNKDAKLQNCNLKYEKAQKKSLGKQLLAKIEVD